MPREIRLLDSLTDYGETQGILAKRGDSWRITAKVWRNAAFEVCRMGIVKSLG
jgi:hypothetical protein